MNGSEFIRKIKKLGKKQHAEVSFIKKRGKGSHGTLYYGMRFTIVKRGEIGPGLLKVMLDHLGLKRNDIE